MNAGGTLTRAVLLPLLAAAASAAAAAPAPSLTFEQVFRADDRGSIHYRGTFQTGDIQHRVEVWRDGATRLKRVTDEAVATYVTRDQAGPEFHLTVLDLQKKIATRIDRSNLYRIGNFTDWFDLAHALRHPKGDYRLVRGSGPVGAPKPLEACSWYLLEQQGMPSQVCWSARSQLPMLIVSGTGETLWRVTSIDRRPIAPPVFAVDDRGFVRNDANEDIERD